jgi:hypothetical protein
LGESSEEFAANSCGSEVHDLGPGKAHDVGISTTEDRCRSKSEVGESSGEIAANSCGSENNRLGSQAQNFSSRQEEDGCGYPCTLGRVPSGKEEGRVVAWGACCGEFAVGSL